MKAVCVLNDPKLLADHQRGRVADFESAYPLTVGVRYAVLGMTIDETTLRFLVCDDLGGPCFAPAGFFDLMSAPIPEHWYFALEPGIRASGRDLWVEPGVAAWGYPELVNEPGHASALQERDGIAMEVFRRHVAATEAGA